MNKQKNITIRCRACGMEYKPEDVERSLTCPVCGARFDGEPSPETDSRGAGFFLFRPLPQRFDEPLKYIFVGLGMAIVLLGWIAHEKINTPRVMDDLLLGQAASAVQTLPGVRQAIVLGNDPPRIRVFAEDQGKYPSMYANYLCAKITGTGAWAEVEVLPIGSGPALWKGICRK